MGAPRGPVETAQSLFAGTAVSSVDSIGATRRARMIFSADTEIFALRLPVDV
jgi:hypothetical protein